MSEKLKSTLFWTLYIALTAIGVITFIFLMINVLAPTFFPNANIDGIKDYINTFCIILSFLSIGLGFFSIWQSNEGSKQVKEILDSIIEIKTEQKLTHNLMTVIANNLDNGSTLEMANAQKGNTWKPDNND